MKSQFYLKLSLVILLFIISKRSISTELNSIKFENNKNYRYYIDNNKQDTTLVFKAYIGKYPKYNGLKNVLDSIEISVNNLLQGDIPYMVFLSINNIPQETYSIKNKIFTYKIILKKCEEQKRYWKFGIGGAFYLADTLITSYNDKEPSEAGSSVRWLLMDKAKNWNSIGVTELSPHDISREDANKYILERKKRIDLENSSEKRESSQHDTFNEGDIFFTCSSIFGVISNKALLNASVIDNKVPNMKYLYSLVYQDQSIKSTYSKNKEPAQTSTSNSTAVNKNSVGTTRPTVKEGQDSKFDVQVELKKLLLYEAAIKKSKLSNSKKQEALEKLGVVKKQMKDVIELEKLGEDWDDALNHAEERDKNGKIVKSILSKYLNESDKILLLKILNGEIESDPESRNFGSYVCGTTIANCKFCGTSIKVNKYYESLGGIFISLHRTPLIGLSIKEADIKELKSYLGLIRSGKYYICIKKDKELFCTPEHKYLFDKR